MRLIVQLTDSCCFSHRCEQTAGSGFTCQLYSFGLLESVWKPAQPVRTVCTAIRFFVYTSLHLAHGARLCQVRHAVCAMPTFAAYVRAQLMQKL